MAVEGKPIVVVGLARSGIAAAEFLARRGEAVVATDLREAGQLPAEAVRLAARGVRLELGGHHPETFAGAAQVVVSPGVPWEASALRTARAAGVPVIGEVELAFRHLQGRVAAVTGTKGKSTTTAALGAMLKEAGGDVRVGGNIGEALIGLVEGSTADTVFAVEVSSFQLEGVESFRPRVAVFLNISPDHLDRHPSFEAYAEAKARIFAKQTAEDWAVVNADDAAVLGLAKKGRARVLPFHPRNEPASAVGRPDAAFFAGGEARLARGGVAETLFPRSAVRLRGAHLMADLLAAAAAARLMGASPEAITRAVTGFLGLEHVLEPVATVRGVDFFNDSKATNVDAARRSLEAFSGPVLMILGGRYKGGDFAELGPGLRERGKRVLAIGEARERIVSALGGSVPVVPCASLVEAVELAFRAARPGDTVLLAPACSSFDMFTDYADRGRQFKEEVGRLAAREGAGGRGPSEDG
ncbi:MAG TPA: UDP-N-acetylmuramoyl-L-alanine--D-glutamate ligase [Vicinamibacteria bacterium]|jgi:UDP-N-acetylmuramoylalanine--D-glutamate ligase|nr:UDP-N-acetylmuramoyl-L-alanine--D-glutamate ligase [Vicinamibacteria bacterium]